MAISYGLYTIEPDILVIDLSGSITGGDLVDLLGVLVDNPLFRESTKRIWDGRGISELVLDLQDVTALRQEIDAYTASIRGRAAIVVRREIDQMAAHLYRAYLATRTFEVFTNMDEALAWIRREDGPAR